MNYRLATEHDLAGLAEMRWSFRTEDGAGHAVIERAEFLEACIEFLRQGLAEGRWAYWIAERQGEIISHICVQRVGKVPKPERLGDEFGYVTNVYTKPAYRGQGIGTELMARVTAWARREGLDTLIVWPSEQSAGFYGRAGFSALNTVLELELRSEEGWNDPGRGWAGGGTDCGC